MTFTNEEGEQDTEDLTYNRQDFYVTTSNKQLNFVQHIKTMLKADGKERQPWCYRITSCLKEAPEKPSVKTIGGTNLHTILRLPTGIFYKQGVKANVLFFDNKPSSKIPGRRRSGSMISEPIFISRSRRARSSLKI